MADYKERRFSIDPGKAKKMDGCPYSIYEDGRDVKDYIIPPKGYFFTGFRFDPDDSNQIYDGKLIAEYEKETFNDLLRSNLWKLILALVIIGVVIGVALLAANVFKNPKPAKKPTPAIDTTETPPTNNTDNTTLSDSIAAAMESDTALVTDTALSAAIDTVTPTDSTDNQNAQFKEAFWSLIHQRTIMMDPYHELYLNYKDKAEGEEFDYLRLTILKNFKSFKVWYTQLQQIPPSELEKLNSIEDLKKKLDGNP